MTDADDVLRKVKDLAEAVETLSKAVALLAADAGNRPAADMAKRAEKEAWYIT